MPRLTTPPTVSPGTVSKILWHFTGGPTWDGTKEQQGTSPKPALQAYKNLKAIVKSRELRLGTYKERVRVEFPEVRRYNPRTKRFRRVPARDVCVESLPVCCVSDIPAPHLRYHAYRYGKFAIGFYRDAVIAAGFNPVFYTLKNTKLLRVIYRGLAALDDADAQSLAVSLSSLSFDLFNVEGDCQDEVEHLASEASLAGSEAEDLDIAIGAGRAALRRFAAFTKTFSNDEFATVYCEREWRSIMSYSFSLSDIAMIVLPRIVDKRLYFERFVGRFARSSGLPRSLPIIPWDDLIEH